VIYGKLTVHPSMTDRQTKFTLRSLERGTLTLAPTVSVKGVHSCNIHNLMKTPAVKKRSLFNYREYTSCLAAAKDGQHYMY